MFRKATHSVVCPMVYWHGYEEESDESETKDPGRVDRTVCAGGPAVVLWRLYGVFRLYVCSGLLWISGYGYHGKSGRSVPVRHFTVLSVYLFFHRVLCDGPAAGQKRSKNRMSRSQRTRSDKRCGKLRWQRKNRSQMAREPKNRHKNSRYDPDEGLPAVFSIDQGRSFRSLSVNDQAFFSK